jgi:tetratricopeptide (TPR) repeat protein
MGIGSLQSCDFFSKKPPTGKATEASKSNEIIDISKQINENPKESGLYFKRGNRYRLLKEDSLALLDYKKAISIDTTQAKYYSALADLLFDHKDVAGSLTYIQKAIQLDPLDEVAHLKMARMFLFTEENIDKIKSVVYTNEPIPDERRKHILYSKTKGLLKDFNYNRFKEIPFPTNNSMQTYSELLFLRDLPQDEEFVKVNDDIEGVFRKVCKDHNIEYPENLVNELFFASSHHHGFIISFSSSHPHHLSHIPYLLFIHILFFCFGSAFDAKIA